MCYWKPVSPPQRRALLAKPIAVTSSTMCVRINKRSGVRNKANEQVDRKRYISGSAISTQGEPRESLPDRFSICECSG